MSIAEEIDAALEDLMKSEKPQKPVGTGSKVGEVGNEPKEQDKPRS